MKKTALLFCSCSFFSLINANIKEDFPRTFIEEIKNEINILMKNSAETPYEDSEILYVYWPENGYRIPLLDVLNIIRKYENKKELHK